MIMLTFMAAYRKKVLGIDLATDAGWAEIEAGVRVMFRALYLAMMEHRAQSASSPEEPT